MSEDNNENSIQHEPGFRKYILVWMALLVLTGVTIYCSTLRLGRMNVWLALFVASFKGSLVLWFFMHLKDEKPMIRYMLIMTVILMAIFIGLTFFDVSFR